MSTGHSPVPPPAPDQPQRGEGASPGVNAPAGAMGSGPRERLDRLQSDSKTEVGKAMGTLYLRINERAERMAARMLGSKANRVDLQHESVVMSVMAKELPNLAKVCNDDQHLEARLLRAIHNRFIDRLRARKDVNPDSRNAEGDETNFDKADSADGPRSVVESYENSAVEKEALAKLVIRLAGACKSDDERTMVEQFLLKNQGWSAIAKQLGKNETAMKVAFSRLRKRLLEAVMKPLEPMMTGPEWAVVQHICIDRRSLPEGAALIGSSPEHLMSILQTRVLPTLRAEYGAAGIESLIRLIGKVRTDDAGAPRPEVTVRPAGDGLRKS